MEAFVSRKRSRAQARRRRAGCQCGPKRAVGGPDDERVTLQLQADRSVRRTRVERQCAVRRASLRVTLDCALGTGRWRTRTDANENESLHHCEAPRVSQRDTRVRPLRSTPVLLVGGVGGVGCSFCPSLGRQQVPVALRRLRRAACGGGTSDWMGGATRHSEDASAATHVRQLHRRT